MADFFDLKPMTDRTWIGQHGKRPSQFRATWADTKALLKTEISHITKREAGRPIIEVDIDAADFRLDGDLRARANFRSGAVALYVEAKSGPLVFRADRLFNPYYSGPKDWQQNVRAIAKTLEALRAVDRYGVTGSGEQYAGFKQIEARGASVMDRPTAIQVLVNASGTAVTQTPSGAELIKLHRAARRNTHPDINNGVRAQWDLVEEAAAFLGLRE
ncbi:hypothetical protein ATK17_1779 [Branchiibius hedensis]|uniref:DnaJ domain-containing protein n=2 Tax=Branchiibius TaxID=908251 RepID=A0A2Y8ZX58_9MICO|nr:hypothetical protein [Branchiibius hedensis]PWJ25644.1 hypothetical protein ATK17_1779 [Branchiibius hedensis]SSA34457.1 hypothetical protein SAMN04489750_1779 [Branchiibius hedensis]